MRNQIRTGVVLLSLLTMFAASVGAKSYEHWAPETDLALAVASGDVGKVAAP